MQSNHIGFKKRKTINVIIFLFLTITTQIGGIAFLASIVLKDKMKWENKTKAFLLFVGFYALATFLIIPLIAPLFGREKIKNSERIQATSFMTVLLNRNYVRPELNMMLTAIADDLKETEIYISYLDANFPFLNKFPLLPHLSHHDGRKIDLSLIYETKEGKITHQQKSNSGYGVFEYPKENEINQIEKCKAEGYFQYDYPKYLTFGTKNENLGFSQSGNKKLLEAVLKQTKVEKIFIEPHLKERLKLKDDRIRYHGCQAVRHDDHLHLQLK